jgi:type IV pilus assembly protein PilC
VEFRCRVASHSGEISEGLYAADSEARLRHDLEEKGFLLLAVHAKGALAVPGLSTALHFPRQAKIPTVDFLVFNQELATLLRAGMPLVQSLDLLRRRVASASFRSVLDDVHERVRSGGALSDAFAAHGSMFPSVYTASLLAGERSGSLDVMLRRFVEYSKIIATVRRKTVSALVYPAVLVSLALVLVGIIVLKVVPAFADFYASFNAELPLITRIIVRVSSVIRDQFAFVAIGAVTVVGGFVVWIQQANQKTRFDRWILRIPMLGDIAKKFATSQMARTVATLLGGGLPLVSSLDIAAKSIANQFVAKELDVVAARVREGQSFAAAMDKRGIFPEVAVKMAEVGESTGALQDMLNTVADFYDEEISTSMERFIALVEPTVLVMMGIVIAGLLLALYMPLFQLSSVLAQ